MPNDEISEPLSVIKTVLIINDSAKQRALLASLFCGDFSVMETEYLHFAATLLKKYGNIISAVLLGVNVPKMRELAVLDKIKKNPLLSSIPVIVTTDAVESLVKIEALRRGAQHYFSVQSESALIKIRVDDLVNKRGNEALMMQNKYLILRQKEEQRHQEQLTYQAEHDSLTGIYNQETFYRQTAVLLKNNSNVRYVLIRLNIEHFKLVNELFGKELGDSVLKHLAATLHKRYCGIGTYGRLADDHFALCIPKSEMDLDSVFGANSSAFDDLNLNHTLTLSYGVYEVYDSLMPINLMCDRANLALQTLKGDYSRHLAYYDERMRKALHREREILDQMEAAIAQRQFVVYLQPIYALSSGKTVSAEALVRWNHPNRGMISPAEFVPIFESNGFISELDSYVWEEVCRYLCERAAKGFPSLPISVNASRKTLYSANLLEQLLKVTEKYGIDHSLLKIEMTESAYTDNPDQLLNTVQILKSSGFSVLMDDFGSGYSSLNTLKDIPVDTLKVDMKFLQGFEKGGRVGTIFTSVTRMANWLNVPVVAEGVETAEQLEFLRSVGCSLVQGYCFAKPMPYDEFEAHILKRAAVRSTASRISFKENDLEILMGGNPLVNKLIGSVFGGLGIYELSDERLEVIRVNDGYYKIMGYDIDDFNRYSLNVWPLMYEDDLSLAKNTCRRAMEIGGSTCAIVRRYHKDGHIMYLDSTFSYLGGDDDHALFCITFNDITEKLNSDLMLSETAMQLRTIIDNMNGGVCLYEIVGDKSSVIFANDQFYSMLGYTHGQYCTEVSDSYACVFPEDLPLVHSFVDECVKHQGTFPLQYRALKRDKSVIHLSCQLTTAHLSGRLNPVLLTISNDETELKLAGHQRDLNKYSTALFKLYDEIYLFDLISGFAHPLAPLSSALGDKRTPVKEAIAHWLDSTVYPEDLPIVRDFLSFAGKESFDNVEARTVEYRIIIPSSGQVVWISSTALRVEPGNYLICNRDISSQRQADALVCK
ncbi:MAG: EAL domain-containing protein [Oscillospiraceae bacterium]